MPLRFAFKFLSNSTTLSSIGLGSTTMLGNANVNAPNVNINANDFAPEVAFRASCFDQEMLRFMYPRGLPEPQIVVSKLPAIVF